MRKIIQICAIPAMMNEVEIVSAPSVVALCNDGSLWFQQLFNTQWDRIIEIPQDKVPSEEAFRPFDKMLNSKGLKLGDFFELQNVYEECISCTTIREENQ